MMFRYTEQQVAFLRTEYPRMDGRALTAAFNQRFGTNRHWTHIKNKLAKEKIRSGRPPGNPKGSYRIFTQEQAEYIADAYKSMPSKEVAAAVNLRFGTAYTHKQITAFIHNQRITCGRTGTFKPGHKSWNAGTKGEGLTRANKTSYSAHNRPDNSYPLGYERVNNDGYLQRKVAKTGRKSEDWVGIHRLTWEAENGPVPDGHCIIFVDGDRQNFDPDNLALMSRAALALHNRRGYSSYEKELRPSGVALAKLDALLSEREQSHETKPEQRHAK